MALDGVDRGSFVKTTNNFINSFKMFVDYLTIEFLNGTLNISIKK